MSDLGSLLGRLRNSLTNLEFFSGDTAKVIVGDKQHECFLAKFSGIVEPIEFETLSQQFSQHSICSTIQTTLGVRCWIIG